MRFSLPALTIAVLSGLSVADAKVCARCADTIVYSFQTRQLTLVRQSSVSTLNTVQCNYDSPSISGFSPYCVYNNINGSLYFTNTGSACPTPVPTFTVTDTRCPTKFPAA
ncbi:hypothetical protein E1B28_002173 [Marasmius oreades]|uniref:Uncharacterized protein n=1 Tax=Marasmius oreades TaxID=181124 RepID=A0A9P7UNP6_9AGAR|nr:uncharacterized protein E1B28_002173 [Marasmius oreades]KAG7086209.1 hypothetical protein E1B28_002173 [Marasmius oreades]